jgi:hypothetical protein
VDFGDMCSSLSALRKLHLIVLGSTPGPEMKSNWVKNSRDFTSIIKNKSWICTMITPNRIVKQTLTGLMLEEYCTFENGFLQGWTVNLMSLNQAIYKKKRFAFAKAMMGGDSGLMKLKIDKFSVNALKFLRTH